MNQAVNHILPPTSGTLALNSPVHQAATLPHSLIAVDRQTGKPVISQEPHVMKACNYIKSNPSHICDKYLINSNGVDSTCSYYIFTYDLLSSSSFSFHFI